MEENTGYVYFAQMENGGPVKIGKSKDPTKRIRGIASGMPCDLIPIMLIPGAHLEKAFHRYFDHVRMKGEWFDSGFFMEAHVRAMLGRVQSYIQIRGHKVPIVDPPPHMTQPAAPLEPWTAQDEANMRDNYDARQGDEKSKSVIGKYKTRTGKIIF